MTSAKEVQEERNYNLVRNLNDEIERLETVVSFAEYNEDYWRNIATGLVENCILKKYGVEADDKAYEKYWSAIGETNLSEGETSD